MSKKLKMSKYNYTAFDENGNLILYNFLTGLNSLSKVNKVDVEKFNKLFLSCDNVEYSSSDKYYSVVEKMEEMGILVDVNILGLDVVFPMGYNSTVRLSNNDIVLYLNYEINKLCRKGKEIILTASQAQTVPYYCNNILEFPNMQYHFALGTQPDAIILCVNLFDEISYIRNSVYALMGLTGASIIAFVVFPMTFVGDWKDVFGNSRRKITDDEFEQFSDTLKKEFNKPVFLLGQEQHMEELCQEIIDFF